MGLSQLEFKEKLKTENAILKRRNQDLERQLKDTVKLKDIEIRELRWELKKLGDELRELEKQQEWQPKETAPKDGTHFLTIEDNIISTAFYNDYEQSFQIIGAYAGGYDCLGCSISYWQPLPQLPNGE